MTSKEYREKCKNLETVDYTYDNAPEKVKKAYDKFFLICMKKYMKNPTHFEYSVASERIALFMDGWDFDYLYRLFARNGVFMSPVAPHDFFIPVEDLENWITNNINNENVMKIK